jgi:hypothetical protein
LNRIAIFWVYQNIRRIHKWSADRYLYIYI